MTHTAWNPMLPPGVTADDIQGLLFSLDITDFAGLSAVAEACGFVWQLGTAWWEDEYGPEYVGVFKCVIYGYTWDRWSADLPYHEGDQWESSPGVTEPTLALREALRKALEYVAQRFEDVEGDEGDG